MHDVDECYCVLCSYFFASFAVFTVVCCTFSAKPGDGNLLLAYVRNRYHLKDLPTCNQAIGNVVKQAPVTFNAVLSLYLNSTHRNFKGSLAQSFGCTSSRERD